MRCQFRYTRQCGACNAYADGHVWVGEQVHRVLFPGCDTVNMQPQLPDCASARVLRVVNPTAPVHNCVVCDCVRTVLYSGTRA